MKNDRLLLTIDKTWSRIAFCWRQYEPDRPEVDCFETPFSRQDPVFSADCACSAHGSRSDFSFWVFSILVVRCSKRSAGILLRCVQRHRSEMVDLGYGSGFTNLSFGGSLPADANPGTCGDRRAIHLKTPSRLRIMGWVVVAGSLLRTVFCAELLMARIKARTRRLDLLGHRFRRDLYGNPAGGARGGFSPRLRTQGRERTDGIGRERWRFVYISTG